MRELLTCLVNNFIRNTLNSPLKMLYFLDDVQAGK